MIVELLAFAMALYFFTSFADLLYEETPVNDEKAVNKNDAAIDYDDGTSDKDLTWGFDDTRFELVPGSDDVVVMTGSRYDICHQRLPYMVPFLRDLMEAPHLGKADPIAPSWHENISDPRPIRSEFYEAIDGIPYSTKAKERLRNAFGQGFEDMFRMFFQDREERLRAYDLVVYPTTTEHVQRLVEWSSKYKYKVVPVGGRTNVTMALKIPHDDDDVWIACNMQRMNKVLHFDAIDGVATFESGIAGRHLERYLNQKGFTIGHVPDSMEFSTLGGWVSTGASGMKKNKYGNIEDIVQEYSVETPKGTLRMGSTRPRVSEGVQDKNVLIGAEGNLGVVTTVTVKIRPLPDQTVYDSVLFHSLETGVMFLEALVRSEGGDIASVRLMDNTQFRMGQAMKEQTGFLLSTKKAIEKWYVLTVKQFDPMKMVACTFVFEGTREKVAFQQCLVRKLARAYNGMFAGSSNGKRGYNMTLSIAYLRDFAATFSVLAESFETSVPWSSSPAKVIRDVVAGVRAMYRASGKPGAPLIGGRVTQLYVTGVTLYFYFAYPAEITDRKQAMHDYEEMIREARRIILSHGGSLSHHHGLGKVRGARFQELHAGSGKFPILQSVKRTYDPDNTFAIGNGQFSA